jgi:NAD(P)-dependent dehydrogenase (short-subunit alcohol dehydrogenase family)
VVLADIVDAEDTVIRIASEGGEALNVTTDVSSEAEVKRLFQRATGRFPGIDMLVNCAGIGSPRPILIDEAEMEEWERLVRVNLSGTFLCCRAAIPAMRKSGRGSIVNVASELGLVGAPRSAMYAATKGGVIQLTRALAVDHGADNIRVNCVCPGPVDTPLLRRSFESAANPDARRSQEIASILLGRLGTPQEIAAVICFLLSDEASFMTGSIVVADGGVTAR